MVQIPNAARVLLDAISSGESAGNYGIIYGGDQLSDFTDHPRQYVSITTGPNAGKKSSAAGRYQFLASTWDDQAAKLGLNDFSPESQDAAAWNLAQETYAAKTGRDLLADLEAGDTSRVAGALKGQWTSLPGGIERGQTAGQFASQYGNALGSTDAPNALTAMPTSDGNAFSSGSLAMRAAPQWVSPILPPQVTFQPLQLHTRRSA